MVKAIIYAILVAINLAAFIYIMPLGMALVFGILSAIICLLIFVE